MSEDPFDDPTGVIVVREYQPDAPAGLIGDWLDARGITWRISRPAEEPNVEDAVAIIALGSSMSAYWNQPTWVPSESDMLAARVEAEVPVLGICFGAQVLARALGGTVSAAATPEIGWVRPISDQPELGGPYLAWHFDSITLPPGAQPLAVTPHALQAYHQGRAMGFQFHPEVTPEIWHNWANDDPDALNQHVPDPLILAEEIAGSAAATRERTFGLLDWWRAWLATHQ